MSRFPALFVAHGSPMVALQDDGWNRALSAWSAAQPPPRAIVAISAHWESAGGVRVTTAERPRVMHDFGGFPAALYELDYPAPGDPPLAARILDRLAGAGLAAEPDAGRGFDHGVWVPLRFLYPAAHLPVVALSLPVPRDAEALLTLGQALAPLREDGILVMGSGGVVHNLRELDWRDKFAPTPEWAEAFDTRVAERLARGEFAELAGDRDGAPDAARAVPTAEHYDPLPVIAAAAGADTTVETLFAGFHHGSLSMRSVAFR